MTKKLADGLAPEKKEILGVLREFIGDGSPGNRKIRFCPWYPVLIIKGVKKYNITGKEIMDSVAKYYTLDNGMSFINTNSIDIRDSSPRFVLSMDRLDMSRDGITHLNIIDFLRGKSDIILT